MPPVLHSTSSRRRRTCATRRKESTTRNLLHKPDSALTISQPRSTSGGSSRTLQAARSPRLPSLFAIVCRSFKLVMPPSSRRKERNAGRSNAQRRAQSGSVAPERSAGGTTPAAARKDPRSSSREASAAMPVPAANARARVAPRRAPRSRASRAWQLICNNGDATLAARRAGRGAPPRRWRGRVQPPSS